MMNISNNSTVLRLQLVTNNIYAYVGLVIFIFGTIGNFSNIFIFMRIHSLSNLASSWLLLASFVGSQCVLSTGVLSRSIFGISGIDPLVSSVIWCKIRWILGPLGGSTALTCIALAAIDRYFITSRKISQHRWITAQRARYMIAIVVLLWLSTLLPNAVYYIAPACSIKDPIYALYQRIFSLITYSLLPLFVLAVFSALTWFNLRNINTRAIRLNRIQRQVNKMMIAQIGVVLLTSVPNILLQIYMWSSSMMVKSSLRVAQEGLSVAILSMLGFVTHAATFYVYLIASRKYRETAKTILFRCQNQSSRVSSRVI